MTLKFATLESWEQAERLMQPAFIRVIDNIRKHLEQSSWHGTYEDVQVWPDDTPPETRQRVLKLQDKLADADPNEVGDIQRTLETLPQPFPGYELCLTQADHRIHVDLWDLCYHICFSNYGVDEGDRTTPVEVDQTLFDETGEVDWHQLDAKARDRIAAIFDQLPTD